MKKLELAAILVTVDGYFTIQKVVEGLKKQDRAAHLELIIITTTREQLGLEEDLSPFFGSVKVVELGVIELKDQAIASGIRVAESPVVVLTEDHAYPRPGWASALIEAHRKDWGGVAPAILNANPKSMLSWANYLLSYGAWFDPQSQITDDVPLHNGSYKRQVLMEFDERLEELLNRNSDLNTLIKNKGYELFLESGAAVDHLNVSKLSSTLSLRFNVGRYFAANRSRKEGWGFGKKAAYVLLSPLFPILRLRFIWPCIKRVRQKHTLFPRIIPALSIALLAHAAGEAAGYAFGFGQTARQLMEFEYNRFPHLNKEDRSAQPQGNGVPAKIVKENISGL